MGTYDKKDIKTIINRAAELQQFSSGADSLDHNHAKLSLEDVEEIAREAGVSPDYVRQAALEYEGIPVEKPLFLDTGTNHEIELVGFANGTLDKKTWVEIRSIIEYHFDNPGKVTRRPDGIEWKADPTGILKIFANKKSPEVTISTKGNKSEIRIKKSIQSTNKLNLFTIAAYAFTLLMVFLSITETEIGLLFVGGFGIVLGEIFRRWVRRKKENHREWLTELMKKIQSTVTRRSSYQRETRPQRSEHTIDLPADSDDSQQGEGDQSDSRQSTR